MSDEKHKITPPPTQCGLYKHYRGGDYQVLDCVHHSETTEPLVLYRQLDNPTGLWVRPYAMFFGVVEVDGVEQPRFKLVKACECMKKDHRA
jgi:hypothetical protein